MPKKALQEKISVNRIKYFFIDTWYLTRKEEPSIENFCNKTGGSSD